MPRAGDIDAEWTDDECLQKIRFCDAIFNVYELQRVSADADDVDPNSTPAVVGPGRDRQQRWEREFRLAFGEIASGRSIDVEWFSENQGRVEIYAAGVDEPLHSTGSISTDEQARTAYARQPLVYSNGIKPYPNDEVGKPDDRSCRAMENPRRFLGAASERM